MAWTFYSGYSITDTYISWILDVQPLLIYIYIKVLYNIRYYIYNIKVLYNIIYFRAYEVNNEVNKKIL